MFERFIFDVILFTWIDRVILYPYPDSSFAPNAGEGGLDFFLEAGDQFTVGERLEFARPRSPVTWREVEESERENIVLGQRPIPSPPGARPQDTKPNKNERAESPYHPSIPHIAFIVFDSVFSENSPILILKCSFPVMFLLIIYVLP